MALVKMDGKGSRDFFDRFFGCLHEVFRRSVLIWQKHAGRIYSTTGLETVVEIRATPSRIYWSSCTYPLTRSASKDYKTTGL
jgi:hypothetical protein